MKREMLTFKIEPMKRRNHVAEDMLDRSGPYKPKRMKNLTGHQRREKHRNRQDY